MHLPIYIPLLTPSTHTNTCEAVAAIAGLALTLEASLRVDAHGVFVALVLVGRALIDVWQKKKFISPENIDTLTRLTRLKP